MGNVREIAEEIVAREGGFVNDPDDPGGATKFGVTIGTMRNLGMDLTGDNRVTVDDVRTLTREDATDIFLRHYYHEPRIAELPEVLRDTVFDMQVNAGSNAVRILQRLLGRALGREVSVDGVIGPQTIKAAQEFVSGDPKRAADAYGIARRNYYFRLADRRPTSRKYARTRAGGKGGWIRRAEEFISPEYHMSDAEFQDRVAAWG